MQGQNGAIGSLPETLPNTNQETQNISMWSTGESSSSSNSVPNQVSLNRIDPKTEHGWSNLMKPYPEPHQHEPPISLLSLGNANNSNITRNPSTSDPFETTNRQLPRKRKATELTMGQSSSGIESSTIFQIPEGSTIAWQSVSENHTPVNSNPSDPIMPRLGLSVGGVSSDNVNNNNNNIGQLSFSSPYSSLGLNPVDLRSSSTVEISSSQESQRIPRVPARRNLHISSRIRSSSTSRPNRSSNISDHPLFMQPQTVINWNLNGNNGNGVAATSSSPPPIVGPNRGSGHYSSRRLSEILRRSLLSSVDSGGGGGGQNGNLFTRIPAPVGGSEGGIPAPVMGVPGGLLLHRQNLGHQRSSDRQLDGAFGFPFMARAAGSEGRGRLVSEIRNVLDLMRRGEGLRFEDVMILDQSVFYGMTNIHDRHRDMRLDVDNMSYEELLALEERIGNVNTGLTEEHISSCLKKKTYVTATGQPDAEPCCICQEEYKNGDDLGTLECGHDFHTCCIKQWLLQKNLCPVCKSAATATTK